MLPALVRGQFAIEECVVSANSSGKLIDEDYWPFEQHGIDSHDEDSRDRSKVITLTYQGCLKACGPTPRYNDADDALNILTTWVLPVVALISNLPFESGRHHDLHKGQGLANKRQSLRRKLRLQDAHFIPRTNFFEPFVNWIGSPQTALAGILFSIHSLNKATAMVKADERRQVVQAEEDRHADLSAGDVRRLAKERKDYMMALRNVLFVICCVGQYEFLGPDDRNQTDLESTRSRRDLSKEKRRNRALLLGLFLPLCDSKKPPPPDLLDLLRDSTLPEEDAGQVEWTSDDNDRIVRLTKVLLPLLAHQLHLLRRRGIYPLTISLVWFMVAFAVGIYQSFRKVGDYTTAHSLAVGLLLSWLPVLVFMSIADRNPNGTERCTQLIERWLYNVDAILDHHVDRASDEVYWWEEGDECTLVLGEYIGQGRYLRYVGAGEYLMRHISHVRSFHVESQALDAQMIVEESSPKHEIKMTSPYGKQVENAPQVEKTHEEVDAKIESEECNTETAEAVVATSIKVPAQTVETRHYSLDNMRHEIRKRRVSWWLSWFAGEVIISIAVFAAFTVAFNTPTIGFGCRAFSYTLQWGLTTISWVIFGFAARPTEWQRCISLVFNTLAAGFFILLMAFQTAGVYNNCFCQSSLFGSKYYYGYGDWGGYVQFADSSFYWRAYHVENAWYSATVVGLVSCIGCSVWAFSAWYRSRPLWDEQWGREVEQAARQRMRSIVDHSERERHSARATLDKGLYTWLM